MVPCTVNSGFLRVLVKVQRSLSCSAACKRHSPWVSLHQVKPYTLDQTFTQVATERQMEQHTTTSPGCTTRSGYREILRKPAHRSHEIANCLSKNDPMSLSQSVASSKHLTNLPLCVTRIANWVPFKSSLYGARLRVYPFPTLAPSNSQRSYRLSCFEALS